MSIFGSANSVQDEEVLEVKRKEDEENYKAKRILTLLSSVQPNTIIEREALLIEQKLEVVIDLLYWLSNTD
jgi:hypothetical protein